MYAGCWIPVHENPRTRLTTIIQVIISTGMPEIVEPENRDTQKYTLIVPNSF